MAVARQEKARCKMLEVSKGSRKYGHTIQDTVVSGGPVHRAPPTLPTVNVAADAHFKVGY